MALCIRFRLEEVVSYDGDLFVLVYIWLPDRRVGIELDGHQHHRQRGYDAEQDEMVQQVTGFRIIREWHAWALKLNLQVRLKSEQGR
jgi:very-short-patch-repair endonuclease